MEYYQPTSLFRKNAVRKSCSSDEESGSEVSSQKQAFSYKNANSSTSSSWLLHEKQPNDTLVMNKACGLDRVNIKSNYWKIPDTEMNLTALALNDPTADTPLLAISSANLANNLFILELDSQHNYLTHHTTISLPHIHGLAWVPNTRSRFLISGNNMGYAHLVSVPRLLHCDANDNDETSDESAEIIKRFNHRKHLKSVNKEPALASHASTCVSELGFLANGRLVSCYDDTLFVWNMNDVELAMRPRPESISVVPGIRSFDASAAAGASSTTLALCGAFGVSLFDTRTTLHSVPKTALLHKHDARRVAANKVRWHPFNEHVLASSHDDGVVRLWDIRKNETFSELTGHRGRTVTSMAWNANDLFTGANDGNIVHWDLTSGLAPNTGLSQHGDSILRCSLKEGIDSVAFDTVTNSVVAKLNERQCGTPLPALNNQIVGICPLNGAGPRDNCSVLLIDGAAFLGLHSKIYDAAQTDSSPLEKQFYTREDLELIRHEASSDTFVALSDSLTRPLSILRKYHDFAIEETLDTGVTEALGAIGETGDNAAKSKHKNKLPFDETASVADSAFTIATEDFHFGQRKVLDKWENSLDVVSLHSVASLPDGELSPYSSGILDNDSTASLSTVATLIGPPDQVMHKDSLFNVLGLELERICDEFPEYV